MIQFRTKTAGAFALAAVAAITMLLTPDPALADKLVIFKNGKALLVSSAEEDGQWLKISLGGDDWMSVPLSSIAEVTDAELSPAARRAAGAPNQVREGEARNYSNRSSARNDNRRTQRGIARGNDGDLEQIQENIGAGRRQSPRSTARTARPSNQQRSNPLIPGLTPLNTNPNAGRAGALQRRGRFSSRDQAAQDEQEEQDREDDDN